MNEHKQATGNKPEAKDDLKSLPMSELQGCWRHSG